MFFAFLQEISETQPGDGLCLSSLILELLLIFRGNVTELRPKSSWNMKDFVGGTILARSKSETTSRAKTENYGLLHYQSPGCEPIDRGRAIWNHNGNYSDSDRSDHKRVKFHLVK